MVDLYEMSNFLPKKTSKENITPHKVAVVLFVKEFCSIKAKARPGRLLTSEDGTFYRVDPQHRRDFCMLVLKLIQSPDIDLSELLTLLDSGQYALLPAHISAFRRQLTEVRDGGVNAILGVVSDIHSAVFQETAVSQPVVNKSSVIGVFLRRIIVLFDKLSFTHVVAVFRAYCSYYRKALLAGADLGGPVDVVPTSNIAKDDDSGMDMSKSASGVNMDVTDLPSEMEIEPAYGPEEKLPKVQQSSDIGEQPGWSRRQAEFFLTQQANFLQNNENLALPPPELQENLREVERTNPDYAEVHFLSYLNCLRVREFCGALDSLYHCFDRSSPAGLDSKGNEGKGNGSSCDEKHRFRYAALNLAILHSQFGHKSAALYALKEAMRTAHEANDAVCLQHAQAWLYRLDDNTEKYTIERSISKSNDLNLSHLTSLGVLWYVQTAVPAGFEPSAVFNMLLRSDMINCQNGILDLQSTSNAQRASLWRLYGKADMSNLTSQLYLRLSGADPLSPGYFGEGTCLVICSVASALADEGEYLLAAVVLQHAKLRFPHEPISHIWMHTEENLLMTEALHNGRWQEVQQAISSLARTHPQYNPLLTAELLVAKGDPVGAAAALQSLLDDVGKDPSRVALRIRAMVLNAEAQVAAGTAPATAISILSGALALARHHYLDLHAGLVACHIANLQLQLGLPSRALRLLDEWLVVVLAHGAAFDRGRVLLLLAKCRVAAATAAMAAGDAVGDTVGDDHKSAETLAVIEEVVATLERAKKLFEQVEAVSRVKDVLYLQALLYNELDDVIGRKKCALEFRVLDEQHPTKIATTLLNRF